MGRRKSELTAAAIDRIWPHQAAVPATNVKNNQLKYYTMTTHRPSTYPVRRSSPSNTAQSKEETNGTPV
jgi:hypothetical protein